MTSLHSDLGFAASSRTATEGRYGESGLVRKAVLAAQQGDGEALHFLYARYAPDVHHQVRGLVQGDREVEEVTQSIFKDLAAAIGTYEARKEPFLAWLSGFVQEAALEYVDATRHSGSRSM